MEFSFNSKFDLGQTTVAFNCLTNKLQEIEISEIQFEVSASKTQFDVDELKTKIWYRDKGTCTLFQENNMYASREEFIAQL